MRQPLAAVAAALPALLLLAGCKPDNRYAAPPPKTVTVAQAEKRNVTRWIETTGTAASVAEVDLVARVPGFLASQDYVDGATVKAGDLLFTVEQPPYQAKLQQSEAQEAAAAALVQQTDAEYDRLASLGRNSYASQSAVDQSRATRDSNRANLQGAKAQTQLARLNLDYTKVTAPFDGVVGAHLVSVGEMVGANQPTKLATIVKLSPVWVSFTLSEQDVERIRAGLAAKGVTLAQLGPIPVEAGLQTEEGWPRQGKLDYVSPTVDSATGTVTVRAQFENADGALRPGGFVRVRVPVQRDVPALLVPEVAIGRDQAGAYVLVLGPDDTVAQKRVTLGIRVGSDRAVESGLDAADRVVVGGVQRAVPGEKVRPQQRTAASGG